MRVSRVTALVQDENRAGALTNDEIGFPVAGFEPRLGALGSLCDMHLVFDLLLADTDASTAAARLAAR